MRSVISPQILGLTEQGGSFLHPTVFPTVSHLTGGSAYAFGGYFFAASEGDPLYPGARPEFKAGLIRLGNTLQDGMGRFTMTIANSLGPSLGGSAAIYIWLSFYLHRTIPVCLTMDCHEVISHFSAVVAPLVQMATLSAQMQASMASLGRARSTGGGAGGGGSGGFSSSGGGGGGGSSGRGASDRGSIPSKLPPLLDKPDQQLSDTCCGFHDFKDGDKNKHGYAKCVLIPAKLGGCGKADVPGPWWLRPYLKDKVFPKSGQCWNEANGSEFPSTAAPLLACLFFPPFTSVRPFLRGPPASVF
jgi:hypothetical protein